MGEEQGMSGPKVLPEVSDSGDFITLGDVFRFLVKGWPRTLILVVFGVVGGLAIPLTRRAVFESEGDLKTARRSRDVVEDARVMNEALSMMFADKAQSAAFAKQFFSTLKELAADPTSSLKGPAELAIKNFNEVDGERGFTSYLNETMAPRLLQAEKPRRNPFFFDFAAKDGKAFRVVVVSHSPSGFPAVSFAAREAFNSVVDDFNKRKEENRILTSTRRSETSRLALERVSDEVISQLATVEQRRLEAMTEFFHVENRVAALESKAGIKREGVKTDQQASLDQVGLDAALNTLAMRDLTSRISALASRGAVTADAQARLLRELSRVEAKKTFAQASITVRNTAMQTWLSAQKIDFNEVALEKNQGYALPTLSDDQIAAIGAIDKPFEPDGRRPPYALFGACLGFFLSVGFGLVLDFARNWRSEISLFSIARTRDRFSEASTCVRVKET